MQRVRSLGQALFENRPHIVGKGFLTPLIPKSEYVARREKLLGLMEPNSLAVFGGNRIQWASPSVFYPFRQDPNFQYLTGFIEPEACLLLYKGVDSKTSKSVLFVPEKDEKLEKWDGDRTGTVAARDIFGFNETRANTELQDAVSQFVSQAETVYADLEPEIVMRQTAFFNKHLSQLTSSKLSSTPASHLAMTLREIKSESEIDCLRVAGEISAEVYNMAYKAQFYTETQLQAFLDSNFRQLGCESESYYPVVAGGAHALTIHYVRNDDILKAGDLVLVDAAGRYGGYCADISRTWPVNGKFSDPQRDLYEAVLATQKDCIKKCTVESGMSMYDLHFFSENSLKSNLNNIGFNLDTDALREVYPHMIGHQLGLDVHDIHLPLTSGKPLREKQVITIEPGIYVPFDNRFPKHFHGIGIRIEDNVVIGAKSYENLTESCMKEVSELQR